MCIRDRFEAAQIDGASQFQIFGKIVLPLGKPILVAMGLLSGLGYWNDWTNGLYYVRAVSYTHLDVYKRQDVEGSLY